VETCYSKHIQLNYQIVLVIRWSSSNVNCHFYQKHIYTAVSFLLKKETPKSINQRLNDKSDSYVSKCVSLVVNIVTVFFVCEVTQISHLKI
jgi:hypothetical protein